MPRSKKDTDRHVTERHAVAIPETFYALAARIAKEQQGTVVWAICNSLFMEAERLKLDKLPEKPLRPWEKL